jgi:hypothetical protein
LRNVFAEIKPDDTTFDNVKRMIKAKGNVMNRIEILKISTTRLIEFIDEQNSLVNENPKSQIGWIISEIKYH